MRIELLFIAASAMASAQADPKLFDYDSSAPLQYEEKEVSVRDGVRVVDAKYASPKGGTVTCYVVSPVRKGKYPGIVWQHGGGQNRQWFLPDAIELARAGAVSILLDAPDQRPADLRAAKAPGGDAAQMVAGLVQVAVDSRRAFDVLAARPDVDSQRIGYAGLSFGAMMGATLSGVDTRFKCFVFMVGLEGLARHYKESPLFAGMREKTPKDDFERFLKDIAPVDNIHYIGKATAPMFFQAARFDWGVPVEHTYDFFKAAGSQQKTLEWYDTGHMLNSRQATTDRIDWLRKQLKIPLLKI